jgi:hypothetical protein
MALASVMPLNHDVEIVHAVDMDVAGVVGWLKAYLQLLWNLIWLPMTSGNGRDPDKRLSAAVRRKVGAQRPALSVAGRGKRWRKTLILGRTCEAGRSLRQPRP